MAAAFSTRSAPAFSTFVPYTPPQSTNRQPFDRTRKASDTNFIDIDYIIPPDEEDEPLLTARATTHASFPERSLVDDALPSGSYEGFGTAAKPID